MQTKPVLGLAEANRIIETARAEAEKHGWNVAIALVDGDQVIDYAGLDAASAAVAYGLLHHGVRPGEAVAVKTYAKPPEQVDGSRVQTVGDFDGSEFTAAT